MHSEMYFYRPTMVRKRRGSPLGYPYEPRCGVKHQSMTLHCGAHAPKYDSIRCGAYAPKHDSLRCTACAPNYDRICGGAYAPKHDTICCGAYAPKHGSIRCGAYTPKHSSMLPRLFAKALLSTLWCLCAQVLRIMRRC